MVNCSTCKHWKLTEKYHPGYSLHLGVCENTPVFWDATEWNEDLDEPGGRVVSLGYENNRAFVHDPSGDFTALLTDADFGCVSHERKENTNDTRRG